MTLPYKKFPIRPSYLRTMPNRPPEWRWLVGHRMVELNVPPVKNWFDGWTRAARNLAQSRADGEPDPQQMPSTLAAERIFKENGPTRWEIEARTLAQEPANSIAAKCGLTTHRIRAYQQLFFSVEDRIRAHDYVHSIVIGTHEPWPPTDVGKVWRYWGYLGGSEVVDTIVDHYRRIGEPDYSHLLSRAPDRRGRSVTDMRWESTLRLTFARFTAKQSLTLAHIASHRRSKSSINEQLRLLDASSWGDQRIAALTPPLGSTAVSRTLAAA